MPAIRAGSVVAFYLFDIANEIDVAALRGAIGQGAAAARLARKSATPSYLQYAVPPAVVEGESLGFGAIAGFRLRLKFFDYGVLSLALSRPFSGEWSDLVAASQEYIENDALERQAEGVCRQAQQRFAFAMRGARSRLLSEDYLVLAVTALDEPVTADVLVQQHGDEITRIVRGERGTLSRQEQDDVLRNRISYLADDLAVPTWNAAFLYDTEAGVQAALEIFEFANSQLLECRYYDELLDVELARIYADLQQQRWWDSLAGRRYIRTAHQLHSLFIDVNEITDRTQNALKMFGDVYAARLFHLTAARLGLEPWKGSVEDKLETLNDIYTFAVEQVGIARGLFLELTIVLILVLELVLFFMGIMT